MAEFWVEPEDLASRDLYLGPWGAEHAPDPAAAYRFVARKAQGGMFNRKGFSPGYTVHGPDGVEWSVKLGPEAQSEVTASRLVWALGFHQPPVYHLRAWTLAGGPEPGPQGPGRFRPDVKGFKKKGEWDWHQNAFVGTRPWGGLLALMVMLNNSDLKPTQNATYTLAAPREGARRFYVVRDLGLTFGASGRINARRNDIDAFEREPFIIGVEGSRVLFNFTSRYPELVARLTPADVRWTCERLQRLSQRQWEDAFRAGGYEPAMAERFIRRMRAKIAEGLALRDAA
jgi:hypothetical protein